jgi:hypothetical protein
LLCAKARLKKTLQAATVLVSVVLVLRLMLIILPSNQPAMEAVCETPKAVATFLPWYA